MKKQKNIFIGLTEVSGYYSNLKRGLDSLGIYSEYVTLHKHPFQYGDIESQSLLPKFARYCVSKRVSAARNNYPERGLWLFLVLATRLPLFLWALFKFDVFIMGGGSSFFRFWELGILRLARKRIIYMCHGTDSRPGYMDGFSVGITEDTTTIAEQIEKNPDITDRLLNREFVKPYVQSTNRRFRDARMIERFANVVINHSAHGHFLTRPFVSSVVIGLPFFRGNIPEQNAVNRPEGPVRILHSPSQKEGKGTYRIREIIRSLENKGHDIQYIEISGRPNSEVLEELECCDFVIDQLYSDYPLAGFATEAAFFGKPAVIGSYYADRIHRDLPKKYIPVSEFCHPDDIENIVEKLIMDKKYRKRAGKEAKKFVEENWEAEVVAGKYLALIEGNIPEDWYFNPLDTEYFLGIGQSEKRTGLVVRTIIKEYGVRKLRLYRSPLLQKRAIDLFNS